MVDKNKQCITCKESKSTDDYYRYPSGTIYPRCKACHNDRRRNTPQKRKNTIKYRKQRIKTNPQLRIALAYRKNIRYHLWESPKNTGLIKYIGIDRDRYFKYLENKFNDGMNWGNYGLGRGKWVIDHIIPTSNFDLTDEKELKKAFHFTNTQPLWHSENCSLKDTIKQKG